MNMPNLIPVEIITTKIFLIRGRKVMLDKDLTQLYEVTTKRLNEQVKRNLKRFPKETKLLRSQIATSNRGGRRYLPFVFTQEGIAMLSSVLNSERAILVNIQIMRAFVSLRRIGLTYSGLKRKIEDMESKYDKQFAIVFKTIKELLERPPAKQEPPIGFHA